MLYYLGQNGIDPYDQVYTDRVAMKITVETDRADGILKGLTALSAGKVKLDTLEEGFYPLRCEQ